MTPVDRPVSLYAATKRADELMAEAYTHLFGLKATGLRYFHGIRPVGPARYVALHLRQGDP